MVRDIDWSKWQRTPRGWVRVPPQGCPAGHRWTTSGPGRPSERFVTCGCTVDRHHTLWVCPTCGMHCAEGCTNPALWAGTTVSSGIVDNRRGVV
ncbi:hypothetical protein [Cellulomonas sp. P5_E12]|jgi:hypothetical protein